MAQNTCDEIFQLLKMYNFEIVEAINDDVICSICKKLMINAHKAPCGCKYCLECIKKYIENYSKYCPGQSVNCKNIEINCQYNIIIDELSNMTIANKFVKCPNCVFKDKVKEMGNHMRLCGLSMTNCPYLNMGCKQYATNENMKQHLLIEIVSHTKMLMEFNNNLKNEIEVLRGNNEKLTGENEYLKDKLIIQEKLIENFNENNSLINTLFENINSLKNQLENYKIDNAYKENKQQEEFLELKRKLNEMDKNEIHMQSRNEETNHKLAQIDNALNNLKVDIFEVSVNTNNINITGEFVWRIEKVCQQRKNKWNYSRSFYSHKDGYKMCLGVWLNDNLLNIGLCLIRGEHDNCLKWPCDRIVVIELINQLTNAMFKRKILQYSQDSSNNGWSKPVNERNEMIGCYGFLQMSELKNNSEIFRNDQMIIKCSINI